MVTLAVVRRSDRLNELIINRSKNQVSLDPIYLKFHGHEGWNVRQVQLGRLLAGKTRNAKRVEAFYVSRELLGEVMLIARLPVIPKASVPVRPVCRIPSFSALS
jgi:hypothetical protein